MKTQPSPYDEGFESYFRNKGAYRNPYPLNSPAFNDFERGWTQALKRHDVFPGLESDFSRKFNYDEPEPYKPSVEPYKPTRNPYAEAKGKGKLR